MVQLSIDWLLEEAPSASLSRSKGADTSLAAAVASSARQSSGVLNLRDMVKTFALDDVCGQGVGNPLTNGSTDRVWVVVEGSGHRSLHDEVVVVVAAGSSKVSDASELLLLPDNITQLECFYIVIFF
jgi:hypothetical protein